MSTKGIYFVYRFLQALASPALLFYFLVRGLRDRAWLRSLPERLGFLPSSFQQTAAGAIWLHAVSVGEVLATLELARRLREAYPRSPLYVSVGTLAGYRTARSRLEGVAAGVFFAPLDYAFAVRRVLRRLLPSVVAVAETEIWPNLFREVKRTGAGLLIVNGRISDAALPRYQRLVPFFRRVLAAPDLILAQNAEMRARFLSIGAPPGRVLEGGNLKYDFAAREAPPDSPARLFIESLRPARVWIAASTMPPAAPGDVDEDDAVIAAFNSLAAREPRLLLVLVPRRPERFDAVARKLQDAGVRFLRRSALDPSAALGLPGVLLLDTIGELSGLFALADVVFMGGTLAARGGHNILEPALFARPVVMGPHMENFREIAREFLASNAAVGIGGPSALAPAVAALLADSARAAQTGRAALAVAEARRGATARAVACAGKLLAACYPCRRPALPALLLLWPFARLWEWGGRLKRARALARRVTLSAPVVSVGNIGMGGTGKTPFVLFLAERLRLAGHRPGILTRGYGRQSPEKHLVLEAGASLPVAHSGDEPQIFLRAGVAPVGIGPDRARTGAELVRRFQTDVLLLDDGFQHHRLGRRLDIVLIDALAPFGGCDVFPLGRLREPLAELRRAGVIVLCRSDYARVPGAIEARLRRYNPHAPVFRARVEPQVWVDCATGERAAPTRFAGARAAAFCGLGNPRSFWSTLEALGVQPLDCVAFPDHHVYRPHELRRMADQFRRAGAQFLLTTEKDMLNLCADCETLIAPLGLWWLRIGVTVERETELLQCVEEALK